MKAEAILADVRRTLKKTEECLRLSREILDRIAKPRPFEKATRTPRETR